MATSECICVNFWCLDVYRSGDAPDQLEDTETGRTSAMALRENDVDQQTMRCGVALPTSILLKVKGQDGTSPLAQTQHTDEPYFAHTYKRALSLARSLGPAK